MLLSSVLTRSRNVLILRQRGILVNGVEGRGLFEELGLEPTATINRDHGRAETYLNIN